MIDTKMAEKIGLVDFAGDKSALDNEITKFSASVIGNNQNAMAQFKTILNGQQLSSRDKCEKVETFWSVGCLQDPDTKQRLHDFIKKKGKK